MYKVGDYIVYGSTGVCMIEDIIARDSEDEKEQLFYMLTPLYSSCTIYTPVNNTKVFMRPVITKDEAEELIDIIPSIRPKAYHNRATNQLTEYYKNSLKTNNCFDLIELCMSIYAKEQEAKQQKRKLGVVDQRFMKQAEELLFGELAVALDIDKSRVEDYITSRVNEKRRC